MKIGTGRLNTRKNKLYGDQAFSFPGIIQKKGNLIVRTGKARG